MRFLAALLLLALLAGAALAWDVQGTLPSAEAACPDGSMQPGRRVVADIYALPDGERFELAFQLQNDGPGHMSYQPVNWSVALYEVRSLGRLAPLPGHGASFTVDYVVEPYEVPPGERGWIGGHGFEPPAGAPVSREYVALVTTDEGCGAFRFSRASALTF